LWFLMDVRSRVVLKRFKKSCDRFLWRGYVGWAYTGVVCLPYNTAMTKKRVADESSVVEILPGEELKKPVFSIKEGEIVYLDSITRTAVATEVLGFLRDLDVNEFVVAQDREKEDKMEQVKAEVLDLLGLYGEYRMWVVCREGAADFLRSYLRKKSAAFTFEDTYAYFSQDFFPLKTAFFLNYPSTSPAPKPQADLEATFSPIFKYVAKNPSKSTVLLVSDYSPWYGYSQSLQQLTLLKEQTQVPTILYLFDIATALDLPQAAHNLPEIIILPMRQTYAPFDTFVLLVNRNTRFVSIAKHKNLAHNITLQNYLALKTLHFVLTRLHNNPNASNFRRSLLSYLKQQVINHDISQLFEPINTNAQDFLLTLQARQQLDLYSFQKFLDSSNVRILINIEQLTVTVSLGFYNTKEDIDDFIATLNNFLSYVGVK